MRHAKLIEFNENYAHKYLTSKTLTIILSDGWDTGEAELVSENMKIIHNVSCVFIYTQAVCCTPVKQFEKLIKEKKYYLFLHIKTV